MMMESTYVVEKLWERQREEARQRAVRDGHLATWRRWVALNQMSGDPDTRTSREGGGRC